MAKTNSDIQAEYLYFMSSRIINPPVKFFSIIGSYALNKLVENYANIGKRYTLPRELGVESMDTLLIVDPVRPIDVTDAEFNSYSGRSNDPIRSATINPIIEEINKFVTITLNNEAVGDLTDYKVEIINEAGYYDKKRYIFPGVVIKIQHRNGVSIIDMVVEINMGLPLIVAQNSYCYNIPYTTGDKQYNVPYLNSLGWSTFQYFGVYPDSVDPNDQKMTNDYNHMMEQFNNDPPIDYFLKSLLHYSKMFETTYVTDYHFLGGNILNYLLRLINPVTELTNKVTKSTEKYDYNIYIYELEQGGILEYAKTNTPNGDITLRNVINQCILNISKELLDKQLGDIAKSGGEVSIYRGKDLRGADLRQSVSDIDTKVWINHDRKGQAYTVIIFHLLILSSYLRVHDFMKTFIDHINGRYSDAKIKLFKQDFTIHLSSLDKSIWRDTSTRSIQIGKKLINKPQIQLFSLDMFSKMDIIIDGESVCFGLIQASPLDIAIEQSDYNPANMDTDEFGMRILSQQYMINDLTSLIHNADRDDSKKGKDIERYNFYSLEQRPIVEDRARYLSNIGILILHQDMYPIGNTIEQNFPEGGDIDFSIEGNKLLNSALHGERYKTPKSRYESLEENVLKYGGGKNRFKNHKARKQKTKNQKTRKQKTRKQKTRKQKTRKQKTRKPKTNNYKIKNHKLRNNKSMNRKSRKT
jgi:hypothetical protein